MRYLDIADPNLNHFEGKMVFVVFTQYLIWEIGGCLKYLVDFLFGEK